MYIMHSDDEDEVKHVPKIASKLKSKIPKIKTQIPKITPKINVKSFKGVDLSKFNKKML